jgi:hypothetical protein
MSPVVTEHQQAVADAAREVYEDMHQNSRFAHTPVDPARVHKVWQWSTVFTDPVDLWDLYLLAKVVHTNHIGSRDLDSKIEMLCLLALRTYCVAMLAEGGCTDDD